MFIHKSICISPQHTFSEINLEEVALSVENKMIVLEPKYEGIPLNILRRMGKAVRMSVGAAMPLLRDYPAFNGIIIGTANGGMEDCIKFLNQVMEYDEGTLTPTNFVQSTSNAIAGQIGLTSHNNNYNITHVHRGLAFENAMLDTIMLLKENNEATYLLGGIDEISNYNFNLEDIGNWYKSETVSNLNLYETETEGSIAGQGVAMFAVNNVAAGAIAKVNALEMLSTSDAEEVIEQMKLFLSENLKPGQNIDLLLSGENGDIRFTKYYKAIEEILENITVARFKHLCGEYPTSTSFALWLAGFILEKQLLPNHLLKNSIIPKSIETILIYNNYKGMQHSFVLVER